MRARAVGFVAVALLVAPPAEAGILSALSALGKIGRVAGKAGSVAKVAKVARAGKGAAMLKGAGHLTTVVAAERVFAHAATSAHRVPLYVTKADDGLRVVMAGGDELRHSPDTLRAFANDLDAMAAATPEAGVDLFLDASVADDLAQLGLSPNTRAFLANVDGPSLPIRAAAGGTTQVAVAGRWMPLRSEMARAALQVATSVPVPDLTVTVTAPCTDGSPLTALAAAKPGDTVVFLDDLDPSDREAWRSFAEAQQLDLVVLGLADVCDAQGHVASSAAQVAHAARQSPTLADLWTLAEGPPPTFAMVGDTLEVAAGDTLWAIHPTRADPGPTEVLDEVRDDVGSSQDDDALVFAAAYGGLAVLAIGLVGVVRWRRRRAQGSGP